jgi:molybdopterin-guanine dinucleotide biosynthesis protein B
VRFDEPRTNTDGHRTCGAGTVGGVEPTRKFSVSTGGKQDYGEEWQAIDPVLDEFRRDGIEYVLVEGFTASPLPKIVVGEWQKEVHGPVIQRLPHAPAKDLREIVEAINARGDWHRQTER